MLLLVFKVLNGQAPAYLWSANSLCHGPSNGSGVLVTGLGSFLCFHLQIKT